MGHGRPSPWVGIMINRVRLIRPKMIRKMSAFPLEFGLERELKDRMLPYIQKASLKHTELCHVQVSVFLPF